MIRTYVCTYVSMYVYVTELEPMGCTQKGWWADNGGCGGGAALVVYDVLRAVRTYVRTHFSRCNCKSQNDFVRIYKLSKSVTGK